MILRHRAALNGIQLDEIDSRILCTGIEEQDGKEQMGTVSLWGGSGGRVTGMHRDSLDILIRAGINVKPGQMNERSLLMEQIGSWAALAAGETGAWLTIGYRENRRIRVKLAQMPAQKDPKNWTQDYTVTLRAPWVPYWEEVTPGAAWTSAVAQNGSGRMNIGGNTGTRAECEISNQSGMEISSVTVRCGSSRMIFSGLGLQGGESLVIDHGETGLLRIRIRGAGGAWRSAMEKRTPESSDDLDVMPGDAAVSYTASRAVRATFSARGRFL